MWEQRRLWEVWCKGLDLSNGNRLATQRGQLPLSCSLSLSLCSLHCQHEDEQALDWNVKEAEDQRQVENERSKGQSRGEMRQKWCQFLHLHRVEAEQLWLCGCVFSCVHICLLLFMSKSPETRCRLLLERIYSIESLHKPPSGIVTREHLLGRLEKQDEWKVEW